MPRALRIIGARRRSGAIAVPKKRTHAKRRLDPYSGAEVWSDVFLRGRPMFDDFTIETGAELDEKGAVPRDAAAEAWHVYGPAFLALYGRETRMGQKAWALQEFGEPSHAR